MGVMSCTIVAEPSLTDTLGMLVGIGRWINELGPIVEGLNVMYQLMESKVVDELCILVEL